MAAHIDPEFLALQTALAGEYSIERELGRGGMGIVYLAREVQLNRLVAIKVLPSALAARSALKERFIREARMAASLSHPNIVPIHRVGEAGGVVFFVMAYVEGETLGERLRARGPLTAAAATRLLREVAWALAYAHGRGVVHRDVKPDNILIESGSGRALVTDFGIARHERDVEISDPGRVVGTAHFMSPEQAAGGTLDGRSDLYALGVVGFLALSGKFPFDAPNVPALLVKHVTEAPPAVASVAPAATRPLAAAIDRCLKKDPADRFATGEALADALEEAPVVRTQLPTPLRLWVNATDPARGAYVLWTAFFTVGTLSEWPRGNWPVTLAFSLLPMIPLVTFHLRKVHRVLRAGYSLPDLQLAARVWQAEKREELAFEASGPLSPGLRFIRGTTLTFGTLIAAALFTRTVPHGMIGRALILSTIGLTVAGALASHALGIPILPRRLRIRLTGAFRTWFWNNRLGALTAKLLTPAGRARADSLAYRPTEMALGVAVDELYETLPKEYRAHLAGLPAVVKRLESHAAEARQRVEALDAVDARAVGGDDPFAAERARAKGDLAETVAALESIRLDLLRLHGGATDLRPLTTVLDAARHLGAELDRLTAAKRDVDGLAPPMVSASTPV